MYTLRTYLRYAYAVRNKHKFTRKGFFTQINNELTYKRRDAFVQLRPEKDLPLRHSMQLKVKCSFPVKNVLGKHR